jgi:molybdate transport system permease protein
VSAEIWHITFFSLAVALASTVFILPFGVFAAWLLARKNWRGKTLLETLVMLPLVMPPVATGLILLKIFGRRSVIGGWLYDRGIEILFNWKGVLVAMSVMSFPLLVRSARSAFAEVNPRFEQIAATLGAAGPRIFFAVTLPLAWRGVIAGCLLAYSRALGEFGATIMVAGNIPGRTQTLSLAIFSYVQLGQDADAFALLTITLLLAFAAVALSERLVRAKAKA